MARAKRNTELNMTPVPGVPREVVELYRDCKRAGLSMRALCERAEVHHDVPARWRRGATEPTLRVLKQLRAALPRTR